MTALATAAACSVFQITTRLGKRAAEVRGGAGSPAQPAGTPDSMPRGETAGQVGGSQIATISQVTLISRAEWKAAEPAVSPDGWGEHGPYDEVSNPSGWLVYDQPLETVFKEIIIHHSALPLSDGPREIQRLHTEEKGFADIGYQFLIDEKGQLFEGRSLQVRGAHTYGANYGTLGICLLGNFEEIQPAPNQLAALKIVLRDLVTRYPGITRLSSHRDHNPGMTLCPGANLYPLLPDLASALGLSYGIT